MAATLTRRSLFRPGTGRAVFRPPWAAPEAQFVERCSRCGDCITACPRTLLAVGDGQFPVIEFRRGACSFCGACVAACKAGALRYGAPAWQQVAVAGGHCLSLQGVACRSCADWCGEGAIAFQLMPGGRARPVIDGERCNGCGGCVRPCPNGAMAMSKSEGEMAACA